MLNRPPLHALHAARGAAFASWSNWEVPLRFTGLDAEHAAAVGAAAMADLTPLGKLSFQGPDCQDFLQGLITADAGSLNPGQAAHACLLTPHGKLVADFSLYRRADGGRLALCLPQALPFLAQSFSKYIPLTDSRMEDGTLSWAAFHLAGPRAAQALARIFPSGGTAFSETPWAGSTVFQMPFPLARPLGTLVLVPASRAEEAWTALLNSGQPLVPMGLETWETLRVEAGLAAARVDTDADTYPVEAGLESAISYTKGCYMGQETTARLKFKGRPKNQLAGLKVEGLPSAGDPVLSGEETVGRVTSAVRSPRLGSGLALALVQREHAAPGLTLQVLSGGEKHRAEMVSLPLP